MALRCSSSSTAAAVTMARSADRREEAANELLEIVRRDRAWNEEAARKQLLKFFEAWGHGEPNTLEARRRLSAIFFS